MRFLFPLLLVSLCRADILPLPFQRVALSPDSEYVARVAFGRWNDAEKRSLPDWITIHRFDHEKREYIKVREFQYGDKLGSGFLFVANEGKFVFGVNVGAWIGFEKLGLRLYDPAGTLVKFWPVTDFLTQEEIDGCPKTGSTIQWFQTGAFSYDGAKFEFFGPATRIVGGGGSFTVMRGAKDGLSFRVSIDLKKLALKRE